MMARALAAVFAPLVLLGCPGEKKPDPSADAAPSVSAAPSGPVNATPMPSASIAAMLGADRLPAYSGPTGSIEGTVFVTGEPAPEVQEDFSKCPSGAKTYGKLFREGPPSPNGARPLADALVGVTGYTGFYVPERREAKLVTIADCAFERRTIDVTFGQRLDIANKTPMLFAPALSGALSPALMVAPPNGDPVHLYPHKPGYYKLTDRFDSTFLKADVYVLLHPLHAVTDTGGHFRIDGMPVGTKLSLFTRLAAIGETAKEVEVLSGVVHKVDLTLTYSPPRDAGAPEGGRGKAKDAGPPLLLK